MKLRHALTALALAAALALTACGDDDDDGGSSSSGKADPQSGKAIFEVSGSGKDIKVSGPSEARAGVLEFQVKNNTKKDAGLQFLAVEGDHDPEEVIKAGDAWGGDKGAPLPAYIKLAGGSGSVAPGKTGVVRQSLSAGNYLAINLDTNAYSEFEITGDGTGTLASTSGTITASEYAFGTGPLTAGDDVQLTFDNSGKEAHHIVGLPINAGKTIKDVAAFLKEEEPSGPPPFSQEGGFDTAVIDGGTEQAFGAELKAGKYALVCFIPDRAGGPPHVAKGMVSEAVVE